MDKQIQTTKSQLIYVQNNNVTKITQNKEYAPTVKMVYKNYVREARHTQRLALKQSVRTFAWGALSSRRIADKVISSTSL